MQKTTRRGSGVKTHEPSAVTFARRLQMLNASRARELGTSLFFDPAWNMLLDLFVSRYEQRRLSVSDVSIGSTGAAATGLRYLGMLQAANLVVRLPDARDGRRSYVELTEAGLQKIEALLGGQVE